MENKYICFECGIDAPSEICKNCERLFQNGARYALEYLRNEVYGDGIEETDIWNDFFHEDTDESEVN